MPSNRITKFFGLSALGALFFSSFAFAADLNLPSDVDGLEAFPGDGQVTLSWDPATDDTGVEGYFLYSGTTSVSGHGGSYSFGSQDVGNVTTFVMDGLENGSTYYFAVTAYDAAGNESEYYSFEVSATPESAGTGDFSGPTLKDVTSVTNTLLEVQFSEGVVLPTNPVAAFSISHAGGFLTVLDAYVSTEDERSVFLVTGEQMAGVEYTLLTTAELTDETGNSAEDQTLAFTAGASASGDTEDLEMTTSPLEKETSLNFEIDSIEPMGENEIIVIFTEDVGASDPEGFRIVDMDDPDMEVDVLAVNEDPEDATRLSLLTEDMEPGKDYELRIDQTLENADGKALNPESDAMEFTANTLNFADVIAPEDITNLLITLASETSAKLTWKASANTAGDLAKYLVYKSSDGGDSFGAAVTVAKDLLTYTSTGLTPGQSYTFKVTAVDENGNESEGVLKTITLPESGPELFVLGAISILGAGFFTKRKKF